MSGEERHGSRILGMESSAVPNAIAAVLLHIRDLTGERPQVAPGTREVLQAAEPDPQQRPFVHVA